MIYLLDTDTCITLLRRSHPGLSRRLQAHRPGDLATSAVVAAELRFCVEKSVRKSQHLIDLQVFFDQVPVLHFSVEATDAYARVRHQLEQAGTPIGPLNTLIAAHAVSLAATVVTGNEREFRRVRGLKVENWMT